MRKWADFLIYEVRFDTTRTRIVRLRLAIDTGHAVDESGEYLRDDVMSAIKSGSTFATVFQDPNTGDWALGDHVFLSAMNGIEYVKTVEGASQADDLGGIPLF